MIVNYLRKMMLSYHNKIQTMARKIERQRAKIYTKNEGIIWNEKELQYIYGAIYKLLRIKNSTKTKEKALDDIIDTYNYCALLYDEVCQ